MTGEVLDVAEVGVALSAAVMSESLKEWFQIASVMPALRAIVFVQTLATICARRRLHRGPDTSSEAGIGSPGSPWMANAARLGRAWLAEQLRR